MKRRRKRNSQWLWRKFPWALQLLNSNQPHLTPWRRTSSSKSRASSPSWRPASHSEVKVEAEVPRRPRLPSSLKWIETWVVRRWTLMISEAIWTWVTVKMEEKCEASGRVTKSKREPRQTRRQTSTDRSSTQMSSKSHLIASQIRASLRPVMLRFAHAARLYLTNPAC